MHKFKLPMLALVLFASTAFAQINVPSPTAQPVLVNPDTMMPPAKFYIDMTTALRGKRGGSDTSDFRNTLGAGPQIDSNAAGSNTGEFRIPCRFSHIAKDDPIVYPNRVGASHPHIFFGNTETGANTVGDMRFVGKSTCHGGKVNKTGYWAPVLVYHCPAGELGCNRSRDGQIQLPVGDSALFYYKAGGGFNANSVIWPPPGLQMITGSAQNTDPNKLPGRVDCYTSGGGGPAFNHIPTTAEATAIGCYHLNFFIQFPVCWDGVNLDSPNHSSHVQYNSNAEPYYVGCAGIPGNTVYVHQFPDITLNIGYDIDPADLDYLRLSSDLPKATATGSCATAALNYCAGASLHSDWKNGWDTTPNFGGFGEGTVTDIILKFCYNKNRSPTQHSDCHSDLFYIDPSGNSWTFY